MTETDRPMCPHSKPELSGPPVRCLFTRLAEPSTLKPNRKNPSRHPARQLWLLTKAIKRQGWRRPVVVSRQSGMLVTGHAAVMAARLAGWKEIPVEDQDFETPQLELAHMLADNILFSARRLPD